MKKLLLIITVFVTSLSYCQTAVEYFDSGYSKDELQEYQGAIADFSKAIELDPNYSSAYNNRGISKYNLQDYQGAIADYSKAIELDPNDSDAYYNRGLSKLKLNQKNSACLDWSKAAKLGREVDTYKLIKEHCN